MCTETGAFVLRKQSKNTSCQKIHHFEITQFTNTRYLIVGRDKFTQLVYNIVLLFGAVTEIMLI